MEKDKNPTPSYQPSQPNPQDKAPSRIVLRILILGAVLVVLIALSIGIVKLVPKALSSLASVNISISSLFTPKNTATSTNNNVTRPATSTASATNNTSTNNSGQNATTSNPYPANTSGNAPANYPTTGGTPDLEVKITSVGVLDRNTNAFTPTTNVNTNDRFAVKFQIENVGNGPSGSWNLQAALPAVNPSDQTKSLYNQRSIPAGMAVSGVLYFDYVQTGQNRLVQIVITDNQSELRTDNNTAQININATGINNGNYYGGGGIVTNGVDLSVRIMDTGTVDRYSGQYTASNFIRSSDRAGIRFQVTNQGSSASGNWTFSVNLPQNNYNNNNNGCYYNNGYYACPNNSNNALNQSNQVSLAPGESRIFIVGFDGLSYGNNNSVTVNVDPYNQTSDVNRSNNYASTNLYVNSY